MGAVAQLCNKGFLLNKGRLMFQGNVQEVLSEYLKTDVYNDAVVHFESRNSSFYFDFIEILNAKGERVNNFSMGDDVRVRFKYHNFVSYKKLQLCVVIKSMDGIPISYIVNDDSKFDVNGLKATENVVEVIFLDIRLYPNIYIISLIADELCAPPLAIFRIADQG